MRKTVTFLFLLIFIFTVPKISSAERSKILVEKGVIDLGMQTEKDTEFSFYVKNDSSESQKINISVKDIEFGEDNSFSVMEALDGPSSWVSFSEKDFIALPQEKKIIAGKIKFPDEARGKAFYNMLIFVSFSDAESKSEAGGPQVHGKIGVYLLIKNGDKKKI